MNRNSELKTKSSKLRRLVPALLAWFSQNARDLPWRRTRDPYAIWVSEIMLQQTQVKTVLPYWERWMRELPTIQAVAKASPTKLHKLWEGLGYYTRVRNLQKAARQIIKKHDGKFPDNFDDILALPGIGRYTAGAICSIAFNQPKPILDGNVIRVLTRLFGIATDPREKKTNARLWQLAEELVAHAALLNSSRSSRREEAHSKIRNRQSLLASVATNADDTLHPCSAFNQSLMELGALVCTPRNSQCAICPAQKHCVAFREGRVNELPNLGKRAASTARHFIAFIVERDSKFLVRQRPAGHINAHLWEFPNVEIVAAEGRARQSSARRLSTVALRRARSDAPYQPDCFKVASATPLCTIKHSITRYRITLEAFRAHLGGTSYTSPKLNGVWLSLKRLTKLPFTAAHKKILAQLHAPAKRRSPTRRVSQPRHALHSNR